MLPTNEQLADIFATSTLMALSRSICADREVLADLLGNDHDKRIMAQRHLLAMLATAPAAPAAAAWMVALTNCSWSTLAEGVYWVRNGDHIRNAKEIKLTFERACSVSDVVWPEDTNTEAKRLLVELQSQIAELQEKAENLQKTMK